MRLFSNVWSENTALFERLMEIHSNSPKLYYGFNLILEFSLPAIRNLAKSWCLSCKPCMHSADSIPMCRLEFVFFHWKCTQVLQKSLSLSIKHACFKRYHHEIIEDIRLHFQTLSGLFHPITKLRILALILFISCSISLRTGSDQVDTFHAL